MSAEQQLQQAPVAYSSQTSALVLDPGSMKSMMDFATFMAKGESTIPKHLQGKPADCLAITMQAMQWGMSPYVVAQKTHVSQSGQLGYEAQLVSAVATASGALRNQPEFKFFGDWKRILGKVKEMTPEPKDGERQKGKYYAAGWNKSDEEGLGVTCSAVLKGETEPRSFDVLLAQCYPRFSTQWATDPQQQITYAAVRKFCRRYAPGAILGIYTPEELEESDMPPARIKPDPARDILPAYPDDRFQASLPSARAAIEKGRKTPDEVIATLRLNWTLTAAQIETISAIKPKAAEQPETATGAAQ